MTPQKQPCCCLKQEEGAERAITLCCCENVSGVEKHSGFSITPKMVLTACAAIYYSDLLLYLYNELSPYELKKGETLDKVRLWNSRLSRLFEHGKAADPISMCVIFRKICESFATINCDKSRSVKKVAVTGELYIKFCALGNGETENNHAVIDYDKCTNCGKCAEVCRVHAIRSIMGEKVEVQ